ncbi:DMT family transporter [Gorillibacterium sp. CAU 1737]|uniref:DMT family transporter n=1 Tax=Gorillibacterium sp. CAU 1737 TaxID=3140362 RepID=UPI00325FFE39
MKKETKLAYTSALLNALIIGFSFLFTKIALKQASPFDTLTYRFAVSFLLLSIPVLMGKIKLDYRNKPVFPALLLALFYPLAFFGFQAFGLLRTTSSEAGILNAFVPILTMGLAAIFLKERTTLLQKGSTLLSGAGIVFIFLMKGGGIASSSLGGMALLFVSCLAFAGYSVLARSLLRTYSLWEITYLLLGVGFLAFTSMSLIRHSVSGTWGAFVAPLGDGPFLLSVLYLGLLSSLVTSLSANYALSKLSATTVSVFSNLGTVVSIAAGALILGEKLSWYHLVGSALIIAGVLGTQLLGPKRADAS